MKRLPANSRPWVIGSLVAFAGVGLMRLVAPLAANAVRPWLVLAGQLLGLAGLAIVALGVRRRIDGARRAHGDSEPPVAENS